MDIVQKGGGGVKVTLWQTPYNGLIYVTVTVILTFLLCIFLVMVSQQKLFDNVIAFTIVDKVPNVLTLIKDS